MSAPLTLKWSIHSRDAIRALVYLCQWLTGKEAMKNWEEPIPILLWCPSCHTRHIDKGEFATKPHHTHSCQHCGMTWRPAIVPTVGVDFLPGFKDPPLRTCVMCGFPVEEGPGEICKGCLSNIPS